MTISLNFSNESKVGMLTMGSAFELPMQISQPRKDGYPEQRLVAVWAPPTDLSPSIMLSYDQTSLAAVVTVQTVVLAKETGLQAWSGFGKCKVQ